MMASKKIVYIETTVISYLTSRPSRDILIAAHQEVTRQWWEERRSAFRLIASQIVISEAAAGDTIAASRRLELLMPIELVETTMEALELARALIDARAIPANAKDDALHIAVAACSGARYLLTWNCKHIANATMREGIETVCHKAGLLSPNICTPLELMEDAFDD